MEEAIIADGINIYVSLALIIGGIILAFIGKTLLKYAVMFISGVFLSAVLYFIMTRWLNTGFIQAIVVSILAFIVGAVLGWFFVKATISIITGLILGVVIGVALGLEGNLVVFIIVILMSMGLSYILAEKIIDLSLTLLGSVLVFYGVYMYRPTILGKEIGSVIAFLVFIMAVYYKIKIKEAR